MFENRLSRLRVVWSTSPANKRSRVEAACFFFTNVRRIAIAVDRAPRRYFRPFGGNGRDHDGEPKGHDAHDSCEDEAEAPQDPCENPHASKISTLARIGGRSSHKNTMSRKSATRGAHVIVTS